MQTPMDCPPHMQLALMSRWYVVSRALHTIARLGLANYMSDTPVSIERLAKLSGTQPEMLQRLMRFLSAYGVFNEEEEGYSLTAVSSPLRDDDPYSMRDVLCMVDESWWQAFSSMENMLKTGESSFSHQHGDDFFSFLSKHPQQQHNFDRGMAKLSSYDNDIIAKALDYGQFKTLIDMGGGHGGLSKSIAKAFPDLAVTLFDTEWVIKQLEKKDFPKNVSLKVGNFFEKIPAADAYLFKGVLHDFNDDLMHKILSNLAPQMPKNASLLIAEQVMPDHSEPHPNKTMDIVMMVLLAGRQRTLKEWSMAVEKSGYYLKESFKTNSLFTVMEFKLRN